MYKPSTVSGSQDDLLDLKKFQLHDVVEFGRLLLTLEKDIAVLKDSRTAQLKSIAELENAMLRGTKNVLSFQSGIFMYACSNHAQGGDCSLQQGEHGRGVFQDAEGKNTQSGPSGDTAPAQAKH